MIFMKWLPRYTIPQVQPDQVFHCLQRQYCQNPRVNSCISTYFLEGVFPFFNYPFFVAEPLLSKSPNLWEPWILALLRRQSQACQVSKMDWSVIIRDRAQRGTNRAKRGSLLGGSGPRKILKI